MPWRLTHLGIWPLDFSSSHILLHLSRSELIDLKTQTIITLKKIFSARSSVSLSYNNTKIAGISAFFKNSNSPLSVTAVLNCFGRGSLASSNFLWNHPTGIYFTLLRASENCHSVDSQYGFKNVVPRQLNSKLCRTTSSTSHTALESPWKFSQL